MDILAPPGIKNKEKLDSTTKVLFATIQAKRSGKPAETDNYHCHIDNQTGEVTLDSPENYPQPKITYDVNNKPVLLVKNNGIAPRTLRFESRNAIQQNLQDKLKSEQIEKIINQLNAYQFLFRFDFADEGHKTRLMRSDNLFTNEEDIFNAFMLRVKENRYNLMLDACDDLNLLNYISSQLSALNSDKKDSNERVYNVEDVKTKIKNQIKQINNGTKQNSSH